MFGLINFIGRNLGNATDSTQGFMSGFLLNPVALIIIVLLVFFYVIGSSGISSSGNKDIADAITNIHSGIGTVPSGIGTVSSGIGTVSSGIGNIASAAAAAAPVSVITPSGKPSNLLWMILGILAAVLLLVWAFRHHLFANLWKEAKEKIVEETTEIKELVRKPEVFNISDNTHVYADAKAVCSAYDARLATYQEVEKAYEEGAEWCNYGWSEGQMALFPTQQKTFDGLQEIEGHEHDCGRPGINGGYMANPAMQFGVNCFGKKPDMTQQEQDLMANDPIYPQTAKDLAMEQRVQYWKDRLGEILVSPFNHTSWNKW